jgi:hypothetical protein
LGYFPVAKEGSQLLFQLISDLYERISLIITSSLRFAEWNHIFADETMTAAFIDRLTHKGYICCFSEIISLPKTEKTSKTGSFSCRTFPLLFLSQLAKFDVVFALFWRGRKKLSEKVLREVLASFLSLK